MLDDRPQGDRGVHPALDKRAEAAAWLARLHGPNRTPQVEQGFQRWLSADAEHARAYELLTERLEVAERLRARSLPRHWRPSGRPRRSNWAMAGMGIAATLAVVTLAAVIYAKTTGIRTDIGEQRTLTLADGSRVYLNTDTRVFVRYDEHARRVELKSGEALFEVAKQAGVPFVVLAGKKQITALGTSFIVRREEGSLSVTLIDGKVAVAPQPQESKAAARAEIAVLSPGQRLTLQARQAPKIDQPALEKVAAWRQGQVALEDMPLSEAIHEMNRYSSVKLVVERPEAESVRVGGFFRMGDSANFARAVASTYQFQVIERPDEIVLAGLPRAEVKDAGHSADKKSLRGGCGSGRFLCLVQ